MGEFTFTKAEGCNSLLSSLGSNNEDLCILEHSNRYLFNDLEETD